MNSSSKHFTKFCASKNLFSDSIAAHEVSYVAWSAAMMLEISRLSQKQDLRGVVAVLVYKVNFKRPTPQNSVVIIECQSSDKKNACM